MFSDSRLAATHHPLHGHRGNASQDEFDERVLQRATLALALVLSTKGTTKHVAEASAASNEKATETAAAKQASQPIRLLGLHLRGVASKFARIVGMRNILTALLLQKLGELASLVRGEPLIRFRRTILEFLWGKATSHRLVIVHDLIVTDAVRRGSLFVATDEILCLVSLSIIIVLIAEEAFEE